MEALIIVAHGSKINSSNEEIKHISLQIKETIQDSNILVYHSFLELAEPSISKSSKEAIQNGCKIIKFFPYFLAKGKHVKIDIPNEIESLRKKYPKIEFILLPHIGACKGIENLIINNI